MLPCHRLAPLLVLVLALGALVPAAPQQPPTLPPPRPAPLPAPPPPDEYSVVVRYLIQAARTERLQRYFQMMEDLRKAGFTRDPEDIPSEIEPEDPGATLLRGTLARRSVPRVLGQPDVQALLLLPAGKKAPDKDSPVRVDLRLAAGLPPAQQRDLHAQARQALSSAGLGEAIGYDHRDNTRVLGRIAADRLGVLLEDLRRQPASWPLLPQALLAELRKERGGVEVVDRIIEAWSNTAPGRKLVLDAVQQWQLFPVAIEYYRTLPFEITNNPIAFEEAQIRHFARHPESADLLGKLFDDVRKDAAAPELMDALLSRIEGAGLTSGLPVLFRAAPPVRIVEVQPELPLPAVPVLPGEIPKGQEKLSTELRAVLADPAEAMKPRRFELVLRYPYPDRSRDWADRYLGLPVAIEGKLGSVITVHGPAAEAPKIAEAFPNILALRLPLRSHEARHPERELRGETTAPPGCKPSATLLRQYADAGRLRQVVLVGADFRGWEEARGNGLPANTRLLDLTRERNSTLAPDPYPGDPKEEGAGTRNARTLVRMAATTELVLVRVDPEAAYQVDYVARLTASDPEVSLNLRTRLRELGDTRRELEARSTRLLEERQRVLTDFRPEAEKAREEYFKRQAEYDRDRKEFDRLQAVYLAHEGLTNDLRKMRVVWNTLTWDEGYPLFDTGTLSRFLDDRPYPGIWLQSRGGNPLRVWYGMWRDADASQALDLLPPGVVLPTGRWSPDLGFLVWKNEQGETVADLPAGAVLRVAVQWKEAHDADLALMETDYYQEPLARVGVQVFRQLDPRGQKQPADDLALVAQSASPPQRLLKVPRFAVYEQSVAVKIEQAGRYLLRVEGLPAASTRPRDLPTIPAAREVGEMYPRVVVRTLSGDTAYAVLEDATPTRPAWPMPADALRAVGLSGW